MATHGARAKWEVMKLISRRAETGGGAAARGAGEGRVYSDKRWAWWQLCHKVASEAGALKEVMLEVMLGVLGILIAVADG